MDRWPDSAARARAIEVFQRLNTLEPSLIGAEDLTPEERPFLRFDADAQERFAAWRGELEHHLRAEEDHPVLLSHLAKYRSLMPSLALLFHVIDAVDTGTRGPVRAAAAARAITWCEYLAAHARRLYATVTDAARVAAVLLATKISGDQLPSPFTARAVYRNEWAGLTEPRVVQGALECLEEQGCGSTSIRGFRTADEALAQRRGCVSFVGHHGYRPGEPRLRCLMEKEAACETSAMCRRAERSQGGEAMNAQRPRPRLCPGCKSGKVVPILYGLPTPDAGQQAEEGKLVLVGCVVSRDDPEWACTDCGHQWRVSRRRV